MIPKPEKRESMLVRASKSTFRRITNFFTGNSASVLPMPASQNDDTPLYGVNFSLLRKIIEYSYEIDPTFDISCEEVLNKVVKPLTQEYKVSLCSLLCAEYVDNHHPELDINFRSGVRNKATVYLIYSRGMLFYDLYKCCEAYVLETKRENQNIDDISFWIDIFCFNPWIKLTSNWYSQSLGTIIKSIGKSCMLMIPSRCSVTYSRTWCLYELYLSSLNKNGLTFQFNHDKQKMFIDSIGTNFDYVYSIVCGRITSIELAACSSDVHKNQILSILSRKENGLRGIDAAIEKYIIETFAEFGIELIESEIDKLNDSIEFVKKSQILNAKKDKSIDITDGFISIFIKKEKDDVVIEEEDEENVESTEDLLEALENKKAILSLSLATLSFKLGMFDDAENMYESVLKSHSKFLSGTSPSYLAVLNNLAVIKKAKGRGEIETAIDLFDKSLVGKEEVYGEVHNSIIISNINKAILHRQLGEIDDAVDLLTYALSDTIDIFGKSHPNNVPIYELLVQYNLDLNKKDNAIAYLRRSCETQFECFGESHSDTISTLEALGSLLARVGQKTESINILHRVLKLRDNSKFLGPRHPLTLDTCNRLGVMKLDAGFLHDARDLFHRVYNECIDKPKFSEDENMCFESLADIYVELREVENAEPVFRDLYERFTVELGIENEDTWRLGFKLAETLITLEEFTEAETIHKFVYEKRQKFFGDDNMFTLESLFGLGNSMAGLFKFQDSISVFEKAVSDYNRVYGSYNELSIVVRTTLAAVYSKLGLIEQAEAIYIDLIAHFKDAHENTSAPKQHEYYKTLLHNLLYDYNLPS